MNLKKIILILLGLGLATIALAAALIFSLSSSLPKLITVADYEPLLVSQVFDRNGKKIGEFFREKRILVPYEQIPERLVQAFVAAEDDQFFNHGGINYLAIVRAFIANVRAGSRAQGGSTITQQVARSLLLSSEKTYTRKIKEVLLAYKMEANLSKQEILWLYLNQIYLGQGAYGVGMAADIYFRKPVKDLTVAECAILAGLPQAPSRYSPISNPKSAKERQRYVLRRMTAENYLSHEESEKIAEEPVTVYLRVNYKELAPFYLETVRQLLVKKLGEDTVLDKGIRIYTGLDIDKQVVAQDQVREGLRELDKRQGFRGPTENLEQPEKIAEFLLKTRNHLIDEMTPARIINPDGTINEKGPLQLTGKDKDGNPLPVLPDYLPMNQITQGIVTKVDDKLGLTYVRLAETKGLIDIETMAWARKPDPNVMWESAKISKPSQALKQGDVIQIKLVGKSFRSGRLQKDLTAKKIKKEELPNYDEYLNLELEQEPIAEGALVSLDQDTGDLLAIVGGYDFERSEFNRALQAARQTGSSFKAFVYAAALDKGYTPATPILDAPVVYEDENLPEEGQDAADIAAKKWKPMNHSKKFEGEILFRNALIRSLNIPTVKIIEKIGVEWSAAYARKLGIFSPLNMDFTLALGSSSVTLYEMTKAFAQFAKMGRRIRPMLIHKVEDAKGQVLAEKISLDERFEQELKKVDEELLTIKEKYAKISSNLTDPEQPQTNRVPKIFFDDPDQLLSPSTAYVMNSLLQGAIEEPGGTGGAARSLGRPVAGKTGTTSGYYDAWFIGYTPDVATGVWVGFDNEKSLGRGEVGGRAALPIWLEYMKSALENIPARGFSAPDNVVFANIDNQTGQLASSSSKQVVRQAFIEGTEPQQISNDPSSADSQDFYKEDLSQ